MRSSCCRRYPRELRLEERSRTRYYCSESQRARFARNFCDSIPRTGCTSALEPTRPAKQQPIHGRNASWICSSIGETYFRYVQLARVPHIRHASRAHHHERLVSSRRNFDGILLCVRGPFQFFFFFSRSDLSRESDGTGMHARKRQG